MYEDPGRDSDGIATLFCGDSCVEVNALTFDKLVSRGKTDIFMLLEFYSPIRCACHEFDLKFEEIV